MPYLEEGEKMIEFLEVTTDELPKRLSLRYYPRRVRAKFKKEFETPSRAVIDTEYNKKANFPNQIPLSDYFSIYVKYFDREDFESFLNKNGAMKLLYSKLEEFNKRAVDSYLSILSLRPIKDEWPTLNERQFETFMRFLDIAQGNLSTRSLPNLNVTNIDYRTIIEQFVTQYIENNPIVWLDLNESEQTFRLKIDAIKNFVKNKQLQLLGFYAGKMDTALNYNVNLDIVYSTFKEMDVLLIYEGSYKSFQNKIEGVSKLHYHPFEIFDVISPYKTPAGGNLSKETNLELIKNTKFLDTKKVLLSKFEIIDRDEIKTYLDSDSNRFLEQIADKVESREEIRNEEINAFKSLADIQQIVAGESEMLNISRKIKNNETFNYLEDKKELETVIKNKLSQSNFFW
jgi:hypothetical protein